MPSLIPFITLITLVLAWNGMTRQIAKLQSRVDDLTKLVEKDR